MRRNGWRSESANWTIVSRPRREDNTKGINVVRGSGQLTCRGNCTASVRDTTKAAGSDVTLSRKVCRLYDNRG
jgi:hypothetical protein